MNYTHYVISSTLSCVSVILLDWGITNTWCIQLNLIHLSAFKNNV